MHCIRKSKEEADSPVGRGANKGAKVTLILALVTDIDTRYLHGYWVELYTYTFVPVATTPTFWKFNVMPRRDVVRMELLKGLTQL